MFKPKQGHEEEGEPFNAIWHVIWVLEAGRILSGGGKVRGYRLRDLFPHFTDEDQEAEGRSWNFKPRLTDFIAQLFPTTLFPALESLKQLDTNCKEA